MALTIGDLVGFIRADDSGMRRGLNSADLRMRGFTRDMDGRLRHLDGRFATTGEAMAAGLRTGSDEGRRFTFSLGRLASMAGGLGGVVASIGGIVAKLGAAVPLAAGLAATVAQIAPAAGLAATGLFTVVLASQAMKLGMQGVGDAVKAAMDPSNPEAFNEALKKLSPSARAFAMEVKTLAPEFKKLQQAVQERMFKGLDGVLKGMATHTLPVVKKGLIDAAGGLNLMAKNVGNAAIGLGKSGTLGTAISGATAGLTNLSRIPGQLVAGLTQVAAAAAPSFARLTAGAGSAFDRMSEKFSAAFASGKPGCDRAGHRRGRAARGRRGQRVLGPGLGVLGRRGVGWRVHRHASADHWRARGCVRVACRAERTQGHFLDDGDGGADGRPAADLRPEGHRPCLHGPRPARSDRGQGAR